MSTENLIQPIDYTKQSDLNNNYSLVNKTQEQKQIIIHTTTTTTNLTKSEDVVVNKKYSLNESDSTQKARINSLSHWQHITPSNESMVSAGWFGCNVGDRVMCIYCNTICHEWTIKDDPIEVHARLAPKCPFVVSMSLIERAPKIINDSMIEKFEPTHPSLAELSRREATFAKAAWTETSPSVEDLVRAGFFCSSVANTVTCFYCNGSLHKWGANDNPMIEHARWFPHCTYAKHLCGNDLYEKIQNTKKRVLPENKMTQEQINRIITSRLDLPVVERLRSKYNMAVIKRVLEDQWKIKNDDFKSDTDFHMACLVLQRQIDHIKGCKDKLVIPSKKQELEISKQSSKQSLGECLICLTEEKQLACMPCGHLCACVPCGYSLRSCPVCREKIQSFMRINC